MARAYSFADRVGPRIGDNRPVPVAKPDEPLGVDALLSQARSKLTRLTPAEAVRAAEAGAVIVDIRPAEQRARDGTPAGARVIPRNAFEWRIDPRSEHRDPAAAVTDRQVIVICNEGYQSSLAAATARGFGVDATDVVGGVQGWIAAGLPLERRESEAG
jgi:rhodanese-related sulfurtransferase